MGPQTEEIRVKYQFTEPEKKDIGELLGAKHVNHAELVVEKKAIMNDFKDRIKRVDLEITRLSANMVMGYEFRTYRAEVRKNTRTKMVYYHDAHDGRLLDSRPFDSRETQQTFDEVDHPADKPFDLDAKKRKAKKR